MYVYNRSVPIYSMAKIANRMTLSLLYTFIWFLQDGPSVTNDKKSVFWQSAYLDQYRGNLNIARNFSLRFLHFRLFLFAQC